MAEQIREIIFDTETTGLNAREGDRVIEIGAVELINRFPTGKTFHMFINPEDRKVHPDALEVHGISNEFLKDKKIFADVFDEFDSFFGEGLLVAHNASFDIGFLNAELGRLDMPSINPERVIDTLALAKRKFPGQRNSLDALCSRFGIDNSHREKHGALLDSELLAEVYLELLGGKQATLSLDHAARDEHENSAIENNADLTPTIPPRPRVLPAQLTQEDLERHRQFVETLGEESIWKKIGAY